MATFLIALLLSASCSSVAGADVFHYYASAGDDECSTLEVCCAMGRQPCSDTSKECGDCINGFVEMKGSRVCRRIRPGDALESTEIVDSLENAMNQPPPKRAAEMSGEPLALAQRSGISFNPSDHIASNHHTKTFILLVAFAISGIIMAGLFTLGYHKYAARKLEMPRSSKEVSYGVAGNDDVSEEKEMARKAQIYHYQHQKRIMNSMNSTTPNAERPLLPNGHAVPAAAASAALPQHPMHPACPSSPPQGMVSPSRDTMTSPAGSMSAHSITAQPRGDDSEEELDPDFTVYECPGLAPSGEMEVKNPLFDNEDNLTADEEEEEE